MSVDTAVATVLVVGSVAYVAGCLIAVIRHNKARAFDADFEAHIATTPGMGDLSTVAPADWEPNAALWSENSATPIFDQLCADIAADEARYIETEFWLWNRGAS